MLRNSLLLRSLQRHYIPRINYNSDSNKKDLPNDLIIISEDMAVCWHPEPKFPYECSKPLPAVQPEAPGVLKMSVEEAQKVFSRDKKGAIIADELAKLTYTTKHKWFPRARDKRAKKTLPDRTYL